MSKSSQYVGLDVSLKETSICVIDDVGKIVWRGRTESTPEAIASAVKQHAPHAVRIGLESGQLSSWLFHGLKVAGLPVICIDARHAKAALSLKVNKTDANDAFGLAQIMRVGWYREVTVKGLDCQAVRALLVARAQIVSQITTTKNCVRGILKTFGRVLPKGLRSQFPGRVRADPAFPDIQSTIAVLQAAARTLRLQLNVEYAGTDSDLEKAFETFSQQHVGAVVVSNGPFFARRMEQVAVLAARRGLPAIFPYREFAQAGGLMSYGGRLGYTYHQVGVYTGRILKGEKPTDLPVERATKVELVINLRTARALGLTIPETLLATADEVIQ